MTSRRGFLGSIFAAAAAPVIVRASSLMPVAAPKLIVPPTNILIPPNLVFGEVLYEGDGATVRTIPHTVGWAPQFIMIKASNKAGDWQMLPLGNHK